MAIRVTRQGGEVLASGSGELRVSRQMIELLKESFFYAYPDSDTNLTSTATYVKAFAVSASSDLSGLSSTASPTIEASASSTLNLTQDVIDYLLVQDFMPTGSILSLSQNLVFDAGLFQAPQSAMNLSHTLVGQYPFRITLPHWLGLLSSTSAVLGMPWAPVEIEHELDLSYVLNRTQELSISNTMNLTDSGQRLETAEHDLNLSQVVTAGRHQVLASILDLDSVMDPLFIFVRSLVHDSVVGHALTYYLEGVCTDKQYVPFIGESTVPNVPTPPDDELPFVQVDAETTRFVLTYPALAATENTVELRAPELDNIDRLSFNRISRETRGGKLTVFADPDWPKVQTVTATFIGLTKTEVTDLSNFLVTYVGKAIRMQDWEGREWVGVATVPNEAAIQDGRRGWTTSFEFEGTPTDSLVSSGGLSLGDSVGLEVDYVRASEQDVDLIHAVTYKLV